MPVAAANRTRDLVGLIYGAAARPALWQQVLARLAQSLGAHAGILYQPRFLPRAGILAKWELDPAAEHAYAQHYFSKDVWFRALLHRHRAGALYRDESLMTRRALERTEYYNEFLLPHGLQRLSGVILHDEREAGVPRIHLSLFRPRRRPGFEASAPELAQWYPHVQRALLLQFQFADALQEALTSRQVLDQLSMGALVVDGGGRVLRANAPAQALLSQEGPLRVKAGILCAVDEAESQRLHSMIRLAALLGQGAAGLDPLALDAAGPGGDAMAVHARHTRRQWLVRVLPLNVAHAGLPTPRGARVTVFFSDPQRQSAPAPRLLQRWFHLTPSEARVALELADGASRKEIAARFHISEETVRSQVKAVYRKTGVNRQSQLVKLVLSGVLETPPPTGPWGVAERPGWVPPA